MCYPRGEFSIGQRDVYLGQIAGVPVYISGPQFEYWQHTHLIIDAVPGRGAGFSLESPEGLRFLTRSRVYTEAEVDELERAGDRPRAAPKRWTRAASPTENVLKPAQARTPYSIKFYIRAPRINNTCTAFYAPVSHRSVTRDVSGGASQMGSITQTIGRRLRRTHACSAGSARPRWRWAAATR